MGNLATKMPEEVAEEEASPGSIPSTPILTPKHRNLEDYDPRSPSANIVRTPIQTVFNSDSANTTLETEENPCDTFNINSPVPKIYGTDPRSPTVDFPRTPIILTDDPKLPQKLYNKNFDNVRKNIILTPKKISDMSSHVPPKLLESSPLLAKVERRKSMVGVLETNLDYVETNLDEVISGIGIVTPVKGAMEFKKDLKTKFLDPRSPSTDFLRTPINIMKEMSLEDKDLEEDFQQENKECLDEPEEIVMEQLDVEEMNLNLEAVPENYEVVPDVLIDDDGLIQQIKPVENDLKIENQSTKPVDDFDKKLNSLIYTDEDVTAIINKNIKVKGSRTPLGTRNGLPKKNAVSRLKVSDKPRKMEFTVSKIPVFKDKVSKQCENTPPIKLSDKGARKAHWDSDNTLII